MTCKKNLFHPLKKLAREKKSAHIFLLFFSEIKMGKHMGSGNPIADRRFELAMEYRRAKNMFGAIDLLQQTAELAPDWPDVHFRLGEAFMNIHMRDEAVGAFCRYLELDPEDALGAIIKLSLLGASPQPDNLPQAYVAGLFDHYAPRFEQSLLGSLEYCVPQIIRNMLDKFRPLDEPQETVLDLGCGTGLGGMAVASRALWIEGMDLSEGMLKEAKAKNFYHALAQGDVVEYLTTREQSFDTIVAADVLTYIGDLAHIIKSVPPRLNPGGIFIFSVQKAEDQAEYLLSEDHRYCHGYKYVEDLLKKSGLTVCDHIETSLRKDRGRDVVGYVILAEKKQMHLRLVSDNPATDISEDEESTAA